jgi:trans-AT polyketide synthase/acyltransferase/oxidoreductase domain-containing protein
MPGGVGSPGHPLSGEQQNMKAIFFPGQGAQFRGMGRELFKAYPSYTQRASDALGYAIDELCLEDKENRLNLTQYTQPALFVVNALGFLRLREEAGAAFHADFFAGHSLGEFNALHAAGAFDFETGVKLVQKRGALMGSANGGGMAAVIGATPEQLQQALAQGGVDGIDLANFNSPTQTVIAGTKQAIASAEKVLNAAGIRCVMLNVSAAFHSRHMQPARQQFGDFLRQFSYSELKIPVIANATARPYTSSGLVDTLGQQIASPVRWVDSIRYLMGKGSFTFTEIGSNPVLTKMVKEILATGIPIVDPAPARPPAPGALPQVQRADVGRPSAQGESVVTAPPATVAAAAPVAGRLGAVGAGALGSAVFRRRFGLKYAYVQGSMYRGIASVDMVARAAAAGLLGFFGAKGLPLEEIEDAIRRMQGKLAPGAPYGCNLQSDPQNPGMEQALVELYLKHKVAHVEAAGYVRLTPSLVVSALPACARMAAEIS